MTPGRKRGKFKEWLASFFVPKDGIRRYKPDGPRRQTVPGGFFGHAQGVAVHSSLMTSIQGDQYTTYVQGDRNIVPQIMSLLSQHIIQGAAHDSSARTPPPRCHPDTRVKLITRVTAWFHGQAQHELLLWITGPAGVGKSAIVQTFAEYLVKSKSLGASVFISRPNKRNNPNGIFITIAYQLATRIEAYRNFIVERLSLDPELLRGDMQVQFTTFIVEPFVEKKIGAGGKRWGILLDGLDELQREDAQCNIIQLISTFVQEHPDTPLLWIIASRPESHISNTFDDDEVRRSHWSEYAPIDSTEACEDVERFLRSTFMTTQKNFRQSAPSDWPSDTDFLKLTAAASGLFVYAEVVMQFIRDPDHADPVSRFGVLLSVIDRSTTVPTKQNPFVHLDALYHEILSSIPSSLWPTVKQLLGTTIHGRHVYGDYPYYFEEFLTLKGMSILFNLSRHTIYACLTKCRSTLRVPDWKAAHREKLGFLHASFADYLSDPARSGDFYVGNLEDVEKGVVLNLVEIWNKCSGDDIATASVKPTWHQYCLKLDGRKPSWAIVKFHATLFRAVIYYLRRKTIHLWALETNSLANVQLRKLHLAKLCYYFTASDLRFFVMNLELPPGFIDNGLCREIRLRELSFGQLDWKEMSPANVHEEPRERNDVFSKDICWILNRPRSSTELRTFVSELQYLQEHSPECKVIICGGVPSGRVALFKCSIKEMHPDRQVDLGGQDFVYYAIPYPE